MSLSSSIHSSHLSTPQLTSLTEAQKTITLLITRLSRLPSTPGTSDKDTVRHELAAEIHQRLGEQADALELFRQEVEDLHPAADDERVRLDIAVSRLSEDLKTYSPFPSPPHSLTSS